MFNKGAVMSTIKNANIAYIKIAVNKRLKTVRLLATFDNTKRDKDGFIIVNIHNAVFATGDIATLDTNSPAQRAVAVEAAIALARQVLRTDNINLV
jgi:predicted TIM-barrel enzyme